MNRWIHSRLDDVSFEPKLLPLKRFYFILRYSCILTRFLNGLICFNWIWNLSLMQHTQSENFVLLAFSIDVCVCVYRIVYTMNIHHFWLYTIEKNEIIVISKEFFRKINVSIKIMENFCSHFVLRCHTVGAIKFNNWNDSWM